MALITHDDLGPFADIEPVKADAMIEDATALALRAAPCLEAATDEGVLAAARAILRGVILRWNDTGVASYQVQSLGPPGYPMDTRRERRNMLWPSEVQELQQLCTPAGGSSSVYTVSLAGPDPDVVV